MVLESFSPYLNWSFLGNTGYQYAKAFLVFLLTMAVSWLFRNILLGWLEKLAAKTTNIYDDLVVDFVKSIKPPLYLIVSLYVSAQFVTVPALISKALEYALAIGITYYLVKGVQAVVTHLKDLFIQKRQQQEGADFDVSMLNTMEAVVHFVIWIAAGLLILDNLGFDITALIAGLGIGGLAVAIAAQAVLADILAAFSIYFDKPFRNGDFIVVGNDKGFVKYIGIKTTRIQTLEGQELVISNRELTESRVNNYKRMEKRRIVLTFGIVYDTPLVQVRKIPGRVRKIIDGVKGCQTDRAHFVRFGNSSLDFECVYYFSSPEYNAYMDAQEKVNLKIAEAFRKEKIRFAYPTQTVYLAK